MKKHLLFSVFIAFFAAKATASITIKLQSPASNYTVVRTKFQVTCSVTSTYEITNVAATIGSVTKNLTYTSGQFSDSFSLAGFHEGDTLSMVITATDHFNNQGFDTVKVIYDNPPSLTLQSPLIGFVARPTVPLSINCIDNDSCTLNVAFAGKKFFSTKVKGSFSTTLNLSGFPDTTGQITVEAVDKKGQRAYAYAKQVYRESSPFISDYYFDPYNDSIQNYDVCRAIDFNGAGLLYSYSTSPSSVYYYAERLVIANITTNQHNKLYSYSTRVPAPAALTATGAIFGANYRTYEWYSAQDSFVTRANTTLLSANSNYWLTKADGFTITVSLYNIPGGLDTSYTTIYQVAACSVALNGSFACRAAPNGQNDENYIYFVNASRHLFVLNGGGRDAYPVTDGNYVVYNSSGEIHVSDGVIDTVLGSLPDQSPGLIASSSPYFHICNKFIAYTKLDYANITQVWLRDTLGHNTQLTFYGTGSTVDNIDSNGNVIFINNGRRYYAERGGTVGQICSANGQTYKIGSTWYLLLGREVFTINTHAALPLTLLNFTAQKGNAENLLTWTTANETSFSYFGVENSTNGVDFRQIGQVQPKGSGTYNFTHAKPMAAINYYRLKLQDKDGRFTYSPVRSINNLGSISIQLSPNPVSNMLKLNIAGGAAQKLQVLVVNMLGKTVLTTQVTAEAGSTVRQLNIGNLSNGSYVVKVITASGDETSYKFIKQ